jgi:tRNA (guanine-N7-)-methyltransferase
VTRAHALAYKGRMGRPLSRALAEHVVAWPLAPWPIAWSALFGRAAPLALEIGFGNGAFLAAQARARPERDHVGLELSWTAATHLLRRLERPGSSPDDPPARLGNVRILLGEAEPLVRHAFAPGTLAEVFVNHPCPWPKARHVERRLLTRAFLGELAERMRAGARLTVLTDHAEYARWLAGELRAQDALESCHAGVEAPVVPERLATKYQLKAMAQGIPLHYFEWRKREPPRSESTADEAVEPAPRAPEPPHELAMPTLILSGARAGAEPFRGFRPLQFREQHEGVDVIVKLETVYRRLDEPAWLIETLVLEDRLRQAFALYVAPRGTTLLVKPSSSGQPYPTHGVKRAVWCAARWLQSRDPALAVAHEALGVPEPPEPWPPPE